ncbi:MAG: division/cell wall cluster transcriptional repressor MraZ [Clostridia bacterium]|nr:division/cell wall cluster transcriptional repressor MraZ [Clostridia bacterium]
MLMGEYNYSLDTKGRVTIPQKFRDDLGDRFYITKGLDGCLFVLSEQQWNGFVAKLGELPLSKARNLQRFFFAGACEAEPDKQGRVLIPQSLRDYAGLTKDVAVIGAAVRAEIWDSDRWAEHNACNTAETLDSAMDLLGF